jgi:hypothetical protein
MVFTGYFKTENEVDYYSDVNTTVNGTAAKNCYHSLILGEMCSQVTPLTTHFYMQNENDAGIPAYKVLNTTTWDGGEVEYSGTDTAVPIYSCITASGVFTSDQDFAEHQTEWVLHYMGKYADKPVGENAYLYFKFYKVASDDTETYLFQMRGGILSLYSVDWYSTTVMPTGSVTTSDRLCIKVFFGSEVPS